MPEDQDVDVQAGAILKGLSDLRILLDEPITQHALDLAHNAKTAGQYDVLKRSHKSLTQYLKVEGDLYYVGLLGHFSSGKSSTINSVLGIWNTEAERETDQNPTDKTISLITRDVNEKSLLGVIREGHVTIRFQPIDNPLLDNIVLADTPGTGDPGLMKEIARDFLPICDVILFFFSAASPLDQTDMPLLTELHRALPFIPLYFIVTRADELRRDFLQPVSAENIAPAKRLRFFGEVLTRTNSLLSPKIYTEDQFFLVDNKQSYNIDAVVELLKTRCDPTNSRSRIAMHGHKLNYFMTVAKDLRAFFEIFLENKLRELTKIVSAAEQNITRYTEKVRITNNNLTKGWLEQLTAVRAEGERASGLLAGIEQSPRDIGSFDQIRKRREELNGDLQLEAQRTAHHVNETLRLQISTAVHDYVRELEWSNLNYLSQIGGRAPEGIPFSRLKVELHPATSLVPSNLVIKWLSFREAKANVLREAFANLRRLFEDANGLIQSQSPLAECEKVVKNAQSTLSEDLTRFFGNVEIYRAGVFSLATKESIGALGLGKELDKLELEFNDSEIAPFTADAINRLFPAFNEIASGALTRLAAIDKRLRPLAVTIRDVKVFSPENGQQALAPLLESEKSSLLLTIVGGLRDDLGHFLPKLAARLSAIVADGRRAYEKEIENARRSRLMLYAGAFVFGGIATLLGVSAYRLLTVEIPQNIFHAVFWNMVAQLLCAPLSFFVAKWIDNFPRRSTSIRLTYQARLRGELEKTVDEELRTHEFGVINPTNLAKHLDKAYRNLIESDPDAWNEIAADRLNTLRELTAGPGNLHRALSGISA